MVGLLIELVADPVAHSGRQQQPFGPADQIVEIDHAGRALGRAIGQSEFLAGAQAGGEAGDHCHPCAH
jgi:hypothetical protein